MGRVWVLIAKLVEWLCSPINLRGALGGTTTRTRRLLQQAEQQQQQHSTMKLHIVKGGFFVAGAAEEDGRAAAMDAQVWSKLPEELLWEVVVRMPAVKHFQLHSVSGKWQQVLTCADFRSQVTVAAAAREQQRVVACVSVDKSYEVRAVDETVVDIDLSRFVPACFWANWTPSSILSVVATGGGLVCIRHGTRQRPQLETNNKYCVLNPLPRTCVVLPPVPFRPEDWLLTATSVTILGYNTPPQDDLVTRRKEPREVHVATYHLVPGGGGREWDYLAAYSREGPSGGFPPPGGFMSRQALWTAPTVALCAGETYLHYDGRVHVMAPTGGDRGGRLVEVAALDEPPAVAVVGTVPDRNCLGWDLVQFLLRGRRAYVTAHRGAVFLVAAHEGAVFLPPWPEPIEVDMVVSVWRLARAQMQWEAVARLGTAELERLWRRSPPSPPGMMPPSPSPMAADPSNKGKFYVCHVCSEAHQLVCCVALARPRNMREREFMVGFDLDTGEWELVPGKLLFLLRGHVLRDPDEETLLDRFNILIRHQRRTHFPIAQLRPDVFV